MTYSLIIEPNYCNTYWVQQYKKGIKEQAHIHKITIKEDVPMNVKEQSMVIILGTNKLWVDTTIKKMEQLHCHFIIAGPKALSANTYNCVMCDFSMIVHNAIKYCQVNKKKRILLFGVNKYSMGDCLFEQQFKRDLPHDPLCYLENKTMTETIDDIAGDLSTVDAILCCNMIYAISLIRYLKGLYSPKRLWIISLLDSPMSKFIRPTITCFQQNEENLGKQVINLSLYLRKTPDISSVIWKTQPMVSIRETTQYVPYEITTHYERDTFQFFHKDFYQDLDISMLLSLETILANINKVDIQIITYLVQNKTYEEISLSTGLSKNTIKYRVKRILKICNISSKKKLCEILKMHQDYVTYPGLSDS